MNNSIYTILIGAAFALGCVVPTAWAQDDCTLPMSKEVVYLGPGPEPTAEVELEIWGYGYGGRDKIRLAQARLDAQKAACHWMLFDPVQGLLLTSKMRQQFRDSLQEGFFCKENLSQFITSMPPNLKIIEARDEDNRKFRKVMVRIVVNFQTMRDWLEDHGLKANVRTTSTIMVLPWVKKGGNPLKTLQDNPELYNTAIIIQGHLPPYRYEVKNPDAERTIDEVVTATDLIEDNPEDYTWRTALAMGSDMYFVYKVDVDTTKVLGGWVHQATVTLETYETATGKNLGSQVNYSERRDLSENVTILAEEAFAHAAEAVKATLQETLMDYLENGEPYRFVISISDEVDEDASVDIQDCFLDGIDDIKKKSNEHRVTKNKIDVTVWIDMEQFKNARGVSRALRSWMKSECDDYKYVRKSLSSKLAQGIIKPNE